MSPEQTYIIALSKAAIFDEDPPLPPEDIDWQYIWDKAYEQNITGLLASAIKKLPDEQKPANRQEWHILMLQTLTIMSDRFDEFDRMINILRQNGLEPISLKGIVVARDLYGDKAMFRTMGDFDIFVSKDKYSGVKELFASEDYEISAESMGMNAKRGRHFWEIFFTLEEEFRVNCLEWDKRFPNHTIRTDSGILTLEPTYMLAHLILHLGKHMVREGAGIRSLLDIVLFVRKYRNDIDFEFVRRACEEQYFENAYVLTLNAVKQFFGIDTEIEEKDAEVFIEYMLTGGIFGDKSGNVMISQASKHEDNVGIVRKLFFPTVKMLDYRYTYLKQYPFLLPVAWVHRVFYAHSHYGYSFRQMLRGIKGGISFAKKRDKWMENLDLYDKRG